MRRYRVAAGLTQEALAERAGLSVRGLSDLERGQSSSPRQDTLERLMDALELPVQQRASIMAMVRGQRSDRNSRSTRFLAPLVGRAGIVARLEHHMRGNGPPMLFLAGEPGIGKTRLLQEMAQRAVLQGSTVLAGACNRRGGGGTCAPVLAALLHYIRGQDVRSLQSELEGCAWLAFLLPEIADGTTLALPAASLPPEQQRLLGFEAVIRFLKNVAGPAGTVLVLDDLQWAGSDTFDLLTSLMDAAQRTGHAGADGAPLRVVAACRDTKTRAGSPLDVFLSDTAHAGLTAQQRLEPLSRREAGEVLDGLLEGVEGISPRIRDSVLERASGVPFFLVSFAHALQTASTGWETPWDTVQIVRQRMSALAPEVQEVLRVAAIIGRSVRRELLLEVTSLPEEDVDRALDEACWARLLIEDVPGRYLFSYDVVRDVIESDVGTTRRTALHLRVARALEQTEGSQQSAADLAYDYGRAHHERAAQYLEPAGVQPTEQDETRTG